MSWDKSRGEITEQVIVNAKLIQKELTDQAQLHKFKDSEKNKKIEEKFQKYSLLAKDKQSIERLRKKVTHDIEHQIKDLLLLRDEIAKMAGITVEEIVVPGGLLKTPFHTSQLTDKTPGVSSELTAKGFDTD